MNVTALVCARGGSKGIPGKNLRPLAGRPLIAWAIDAARQAHGVERVIVSTDSSELAQAARAAGADVPFMRPAELASDASPEWLVWRHAVQFLTQKDGRGPDALLVVPPTAPLRAVEDLDACLAEFANGLADIVITVTEAHRNPYFNMVRVEEDGAAALVIPAVSGATRRQDAPAVYDMTTVAYVARPEFVMTRDGLFDGRVRAVKVPIERALDIDTPLDLRIAECLMAARTAS
jgi:N-acylneuraminate cytidylyltransferase